MIIFFVDTSLYLLFALGAAVSTAATLSTWILEHLSLVFIVLMLKSLLLLGGSGLFSSKENAAHLVCSILLFAFEIGRNALFLYCIIVMLGGLFSGGLFRFFSVLLDMVVAVPLILLAGEGLMFFVYGSIHDFKSTKLAIALELASIIAMFLVGRWWNVF